MINSYSSIGEIESLVRSLDPNFRKMFENIFDINVYSGVSIPSSQIEPLIQREFGSIEAVRSQRIVKIVNKVTSISVTYNPLFDVNITSERNPVDSVDEVNFSNDVTKGLPDPETYGSCPEDGSGAHPLMVSARKDGDFSFTLTEWGEGKVHSSAQ